MDAARGPARGVTPAVTPGRGHMAEHIARLHRLARFHARDHRFVGHPTLTGERDHDHRLAGDAAGEGNGARGPGEYLLPSSRCEVQPSVPWPPWRRGRLKGGQDGVRVHGAEDGAEDGDGDGDGGRKGDGSRVRYRGQGESERDEQQSVGHDHVIRLTGRESAGHRDRRDVDA